MDNTKIKSFKDLNAWKVGHELVLLIYKYTKKFPSEERFGLTSQLRRAFVSITSNIAEGFSRNTYKDKLNFYCVAQGSNTELQDQITIAFDVGYLNQKEYEIIESKSIDVHKIISGLIKSTKNIIHNS